MKNLGPVTQFPLLNLIYETVVNRRHHFTVPHPTPLTPAGTRVFTRQFAGGKVIGLDFEGKRYVEQNKSSGSIYAVRAREGAKILWVIDLNTNQYLGRVDEGLVYRKGEVRSKQ